MRIAVLCSLSWPFIRRGNRCAWDLAVCLATRGHDVTFITATPGTRARYHDVDGVHVEALPLWDSVVFTALRQQKLSSFVPVGAAALARGDYDVVQATYPVDAAAAWLHKKRTGVPYVYMLIDCLPFHPAVKFGWHMFDRGVRCASGLSSISAFVDRHLQAEKGLRSHVIPLPCELDAFPLGTAPRPRSRILCTASLIDTRKRVSVLVQAFTQVLQQVPDAELVLSAHSSPENDEALLASVPPEVAARIRLPGVGRREDLPALYQGATLSVLPSVDEAFGLVVTESLASGTPVVANRSGALPEIIDDPRVGLLAESEGGADELARAVIEGLELGRRPETAAACRDHVMRRYSWDVTGPQNEQLLLAAAAEAPTRRRPSRPRPAPDESDLLTVFERALDDSGASHEHWFELERRRPEALAVAGWLTRAGRPCPDRVAVHGDERAPLVLLLERLGVQVVTDDDATVPAAVLLWGPRGDAPGIYDLRPLVETLADDGELIVCWRGRPGEHASARRLGDALAMAGLAPQHARRLELRTAVQRGWGMVGLRAWLAHVPGRTFRQLVPAFARDAFGVGRRR
jgi:glycosyltransferase involved in cell wall biosynthesis